MTNKREMPEFGSPLVVDCEKCKIRMILQPKYNEDKDSYFFMPYCDDCKKKEPELELFIKECPYVYTVTQALEQNVKDGLMTKKKDKQTGEWRYALTEKGKEEARRKFGLT